MDTIIRNKAGNMLADECGNTSKQKYHANGSRKEDKIREFLYRDTMNVEHEMCDYAGNNWCQQNSNKRFKEKFGSCTKKTLNRFTTKDSHTWNITPNAESRAQLKRDGTR